MNPSWSWGGLTSRARDYSNFIRRLQKAGVPAAAADIGNGLRPIEMNVESIRSAVAQLKQTTGAEKVWVMGQSKGTIDLRTYMQGTQGVSDSVRGAFLTVGPHQGGLVLNDAIANTARAMYSRLPIGMQDALRAHIQLLKGSPELTELQRGYKPFMDSMPEDFTIHNFVSDITPKALPGGHDLLVPLASQKLPQHARMVEHQLQSGGLNHVTAHLNDEFVDHILTSVRQSRDARLGVGEAAALA